MNNITANNYYNFGPNNGVNQRPARVGHLNAVINALNQGGSGGVTWGSITGTLALQTDLQLALDNKVDKNAAITGATKTKITYDAKGLVTAGADATTADIADSTNKRYVTDANLTVIGNTSGTNSGNQTLANTSDATSHTTTLSATGGSVQLVEGSGITLTTTGTSADGIITIASTGGGGTPSGVSGAVQFSNGSAFASDATNFFWDNTNKRLGIGTTTIGSNLQVNGNAAIGYSASTAAPTNGLKVLGEIATAGLISIDNATNQNVVFKLSGVDKWNVGYVNSISGFRFNNTTTDILTLLNTGNIGIGTNTPAAKLSVKGNGTTTATRNTQWINSAGSDIGNLNDAGNISFTGKASFGNAGSGSTLNIRGSGATSATSSVLVQNSSSSQTLSVRDDGVVFVGLGGLAVGSAKFQVKDQSDNICISVAQSDILFGNSAVLRSNDGIMYPTGNITFRNGNPNSAIINFGDSEVNSVSATGVFSFIKFTRNWTSVAPSLNLSINVQETQNVINMTNGTGTKIFRGIYHNPTVTAVTSHRAFESSSGGGHFNTTSVDASSVLQADSTTQGFLPPRMTNAQRAAIVSPAEGLLVHNTTNKGTAYYDGTNWGYLNGAAQTIAGSGGTVNIPFAAGNIVDLTLTASTTLTFSGHVVGVFILKVIQGGTGSYTLTYPASVKWSGGTPPTLTTTVGKTDIITLFHDGTNFFGTYSLNY